MAFAIPMDAAGDSVDSADNRNTTLTRCGISLLLCPVLFATFGSVLGLIIAYFADNQLYSYCKANSKVKEKRGPILNSGLWGLSRHPKQQYIWQHWTWRSSRAQKPSEPEQETPPGRRMAKQDAPDCLVGQGSEPTKTCRTHPWFCPVSMGRPPSWQRNGRRKPDRSNSSWEHDVATPSRHL